MYQKASVIAPTATPNDQTFRGNSVFDPDLTGVGQQPRGFDEYAALYGKYYVVKSSYSVVVKCTASITDTPLLCIWPEAAAGANQDMAPITLPSDPTKIYAVDRVKVILPGNGQQAHGGSQIKYMCSSKSALGAGVEREDVVTDVTTNPNAEWYWQRRFVNYQNTLGTAAEFNVIETVVYDVIFSDPKNVFES